MKTTVSLVITALLTSTTLADTLWRQYGFNAAHTSYNDSETILNPSNVSHLTLLWTSDTFNAQPTASAPAVTDDTVYITNGGDAIAIDQFTGTRRWTFTPADFSPLTETPAIANGVVYVTGGSAVFALDQATGHRIWRHNLEPQANISA